FGSWPLLLRGRRRERRWYINAYARSHGGGEGQAAHVGSLGSRWLGAVHRVDQGGDVGGQLRRREARLPNRDVDDPRPVDLELDAAGLDLAHRPLDVEGDRA